MCAQGDEGGGWRVAYFLPRDSWNQEGKRRWRTGSLMSDYPSTILSSRGLPWATSNYPWDQGGRSHGKSWNGLCPVPTDSEISPGQCQGSCHCQIGFRFTATGLLRVVSLSLPPRPGVPRSLPLGNRASSWKEEKACPQRGSCVWSFLAGSSQASGRLQCHLGSQCSLRVFPETLLDFSEFCCFQIPESALWSARASAVLQVEAQGGVTGSLSGRLCDGAGLSATVSASWGLWADVHSPVPDLPSQVPPPAPGLCAVPLLTFGDASCFSRACTPLTCLPR